MSEALLQRVEACYQLAEAFFQRPFLRPAVSLRLRGLKAGVAHLTENKLRFNAQLYRENREHFLRQTVAHEVAHLVHADHSPAYWSVVHRLVGDHRPFRQWLRDHGAALHAVGR